MGQGGGRPRDDEVWQHVELLQGGRKVKCKYCRRVFAASANRIKSHIIKDKGKGIRPCPKFPQSNNFGSHRANSNNDLEDNLLHPQNHNMSDDEGQIQDDAKDQERIQAAGSISVSNWENEDLQVLRYVSESLSSGDMVFQSPRSHLTQKEFSTLVKPETWLDSLVIDTFVEILTYDEQKKTTPSNWYLPLTFSKKAALARDLQDFKDFVERHKMRQNYMFTPKSPDKVFIPIHIGQELDGHFFLYIIHLKNKEIEIWDSLPASVAELDRIKTTKRLLLAMEELFREEGTFTAIKLEMADDIPSQPNGTDCGIFVIKFMEQSDNYVKTTHLFKFDSKKEREDLALKLLKSDLNQEKQSLYDKARRQHAQVEKQDANKRSKVDLDEIVGHDYVEIVRLLDLEGLQKALIGKNFQRYVKQIWDWIKDDSVSSIGVWGMGGSGKTALACHVLEKLLEEASGDIKVIWVTVSQKTVSQKSIYKLQKVIAKSIKLDISDESEVKIIARKLRQAFKEMEKCVVILDNVWNHLILEEVGFPMLGNRIKLILTTRIWEVCQGLGCEKNTLVVEPLDEKDSWALFEKITGFHEGLSSEVRGIAENVAHECAGLPLAIVRIATSMKGKKKAREWNHMLECLGNLGNGQYEIDKWVLPILRSSYDILNNKLQRFFLYCVLTAYRYFDDDSDANHLIRRFVYESMDETNKLRVQYNEGYNMLDKLKDHSMLNLEQDDVWSTHKFVRVLALGIAEYCGGIMADAYKNLTEIPSDDRWKGDLQKVFLTGNRIQTIPDGTCPSCSQLSTLLLDRNVELNYISDDFFKNMPALKTLDLSGTNIEHLPESVSSLRFLVALLLSECRELRYIPSLRELKRLIALDLSYTAITEAPMGFESLVNLRSLNLLGIEELVISASVISKLINLEFLELCLTDVTVRCIQDLKRLEVIVAHFCDVSVFNACVSFMAEHDVIRSYCLTLHDASVGFSWGGGINKEYCMKRITFESMDWGNEEAVLPGDMNELCINNCRQGRIGDGYLCRVLSYATNNNSNNDAHQIKRLDICEYNDVKYLCCLRGSCPFCSSSQLVGSLSVSYLKDLKSLVSPNDDSLRESTLFSRLTDLHVCGCESMETLMTPKLFACLENLCSLSVCDCDVMKEMVGKDDSEMQLPAIILPDLTSLKLYKLSELKSVYRGVMFCPSLQAFSADDRERLEQPWIHSLLCPSGCMYIFEE